MPKLNKILQAMLIPFAALLCFESVNAKPHQNKTPSKAQISDLYSSLKSTTKKYQTTPLVEMSVEKTLKSELMGKETKYQGRIFIAAGKFRWENSKPEKTLLVFDGENIWNEQSPPEDFPGEVQVVKSRVDKKNKSQILISSLMGRGSLFENFQVLSETKDGEFLVYSIKAKVADASMSQLKLRILPKEKKLTEISYGDDVGNLTTMKFSEIRFIEKNKNKDLFKYRPPKGAQVTNI